MELKKVWMSPDTKKKSKYGYRAVGGILGIVLLMVLLLCGGTLLSLSLGINKKAFSLILLTAVSALGIGLAVLLGRRSIRDATIFFLTENDRLWVMDARGLSNHGNGFLGFAVGTMETQAFLRRQGRPAVYSQPCGRNFEGVKYQGKPQPLRGPMPGASSRYACDPVYLSSDQRKSR